MVRVFETKDRTGRNIYLTDERWSHIIKHAEMSNQVEQIKDALLHPDKITNVAMTQTLGFIINTTKIKRFISVKYLNGEGFIITSFYTDKIK